MKKILAAITIVTMLLITSSAIAGGAKIPKLLCLEWTSFTWYQQLSFKAIGTTYIDGSKVKTYAINGIDSPLGRTLTGTAYVYPGTTTLIASFQTTYVLNSSFTEGGYNLNFNLATGTGTMYYGYNGPAINMNGDETVISTDCQDASILLYDAPMTADMGSAGY